ncbi:MAG: GNAT family N-acetyltransferase [Chitinophagales bacterium]
MSKTSISNNYSIQLISPKNPLLVEAIKLRFEVFVWEQRVPIELEVDEYDRKCEHLVVLDSQQRVVGTLRLVSVGENVKLGRFVIRKSHRGRGLGKWMMEAALQIGTEKGFKLMVLEAQTYVIAFYESLGFEVTSGEFMDAGIPHKRMQKALI